MQSIWIRLIRPTEVGNWTTQVIFFVPRLFGGLLLAIDFGASKFGMPWTDAEQGLALFQVAAWFPEDVAKFGAPFSWAPTLFAWLGAASEAIGGLFLALGLQTRIVAFLICCTMLTAIFFQKWGQGTWSMLPAMGFLWLSLYNVALGPGKLSLDYLIYRRFFG